ncbi:MAG TPA: hypothetical protein VGR55_18570 [Candidatus Acidoferrum sp.]|nr:hypothetical protein [Candidatus Acidoferrum sp.]
MRCACSKPVLFVPLLLLFLVPCVSAQAARHGKHDGSEKTVWNYEGGVLFETDGSLPNGVCFRIYGIMNSGDFFDSLKRIDTDSGTQFVRGTGTVTKFPDSMTVAFSIRDQLCPPGMQQVGTRKYMTQKMIDELRLSLYWKHGVDLKPVKGAKEIASHMDRIQPYATSLSAELPARYEWTFEFTVPSAGVSLMDSLAFVFRTPEGKIAARVAARL